MTANELLALDNENIRSDKYAAAAISYIYKAFGDVIRSKEIWPFSNKLNLGWQNSNGTVQDCADAMQYLLKALDRYETEIADTNINKITLSNDNFIKNLKKFVNKIDEDTEDSNQISDAIAAISSNVEHEINKIMNEINDTTSE